MLRYSQDAPSLFRQMPFQFQVTEAISLKFWFPKRLIAGWELPLFWAAVPKTSVGKNGDMRTQKNKIGFAEKGMISPPTGNADFAQNRAKLQFGILISLDRMAAITWLRFIFGKTSTTPHHIRNQRGKTSLNQEGRSAIAWLFEQAPLPPNVFLQLDSDKAQKIMALKSGVKRVNELFRVAQGMRVGRAAIATAGEQVDYMKRIRYNGGARSHLRPEGIIILGQYRSHADVARALGVPVPGHGESVSARVTPAHELGLGVAEMDGSLWKLAGPNDPPVIAPLLPEI